MHSSQQFFLLLFILIIPKISYQNLVNLGPFYECNHGLKGEVFIKNEREIIVKGFHYDGKARLAWFHSMKKCTKGGVHSEIETFLNLPNPDGNCDVLFGTPFVNQEITLILPVSVKGMRTFGMFSYNCSNLGHVNISSDSLKDVPPAPPTLKGVTLCTLPNYPACPIGTKK
ncbi:unnamed protein product [Orchesella dallaii]|uniref:Uncharacterized protein n=1 Tax=Orchesella dallaii TaxID=48710 RepID=A0ABP1PSL9_9HEXA